MKRHKASTMMETCLIGGLVVVVVIFASTNINANYRKWATLSQVTTPGSSQGGVLEKVGSESAAKSGSGAVTDGSGSASTKTTTSDKAAGSVETAGSMGENVETAGGMGCPAQPGTTTSTTTTSSGSGKKKSIWDKLGDIADAVVEAVEDAVDYVVDEFNPPLPPSRGEVSESNPGSGDFDPEGGWTDPDNPPPMPNDPVWSKD